MFLQGDHTKQNNLLLTSQLVDAVAAHQLPELSEVSQWDVSTVLNDHPVQYHNKVDPPAARVGAAAAAVHDGGDPAGLDAVALRDVARVGDGAEVLHVDVVRSGILE